MKSFLSFILLVAITAGCHEATQNNAVNWNDLNYANAACPSTDAGCRKKDVDSIDAIGKGGKGR